ncbi:MAG: DUF1592 domain-containing protein [Bdellovibrionales bacterium]
MRLSKTQYSNTILNLVGSAAHAKVLPLIETLYADVLKNSPLDFTREIDDVQMSAYEAVADKLYSLISSDQALAVSLAGSCISNTPITPACRDAFIDNVGLKAFRRPLTSEEKNRFATKIFSIGKNGAESVGWTVYALVGSPAFNLHLSLGSENLASTEYDVTPYEVASRLSYLIADSPPDTALFAAAAAGELSSLEQLRPHVDRLFVTSAAKDKLNRFFTYWLDPKRYGKSAFSSEFLDGVNVDALNVELDKELYEYINYIVFTKKGSFEDLITSRESFARTPAAASIYGHAPVTGSEPQLTSTERMGLLMRTPVLATEGNETHPILRGVKFRARFLCTPLGLPAGVLLNGDPTFGTEQARIEMSTRKRTEGLTGSTSCMGCHKAINPMGFAFENFDNLGRVRQKEKVYSSAGKLVAEHFIDTNVATSFSSRSAVQHASDGAELISQMMNDSALPACFAKQAHDFYRLRERAPEDDCLLSGMYDNLVIEPGKSVLDSLKAMVLHESIFRRRM